jgi:hypothetical protein
MLIFSDRHLRMVLAEFEVHYSSRQPRPDHPSPTYPGSGSSAGRSSAASSTNTSGPPKSPGHGQRHSSGTPQADALGAEAALSKATASQGHVTSEQFETWRTRGRDKCGIGQAIFHDDTGADCARSVRRPQGSWSARMLARASVTSAASGMFSRW